MGRQKLGGRKQEAEARRQRLEIGKQKSEIKKQKLKTRSYLSDRFFFYPFPFPLKKNLPKEVDLVFCPWFNKDGTNKVLTNEYADLEC